MALLAPPSSRLPPSGLPPPLGAPLQPSASEPDLFRLRSSPLPLPPGAMPPVVVARSQHISYLGEPRRRISLSRRATDDDRGGARTSSASSSSSSATLVNTNGPPPTRGKVGALLHRFPSLRRSGSRSSSSSSSPSASSSPALSPPSASPLIPAAPPITASASLPISHASPTHPSSTVPTSPPSAWLGAPLEDSPPQAISPLRPAQPERSSSDGDEHPTPKICPQKRAQTMPLLPRTHAKRFYGLMEVVETERNYVRDLALLVDVYLPSLYAIDPILYPIISRNLPSLRAAHVSFLQELENALLVAGLPSSTDSEDLMQIDYSTDEEPARIAKAVGRISRAFFLSTDVWGLYDEYCTQHTNAMAALEKLSTRMGAEWKVWERKCMSMAPNSASSAGSMEVTSRPPSPTLGGESDRERGRPSKKRLSLHDLLIEPVQRICRYPLLLAKLLPPEMRHSHGTNGMYVNEERGVKELRAAYSVMREIVSRVDEARERHERELRGERIAVRVEGPQITESLMLSLGPPLLVGALDVLVLPRSFALPTSSSNASLTTVSTVTTITPMSFAAPATFSTSPGVVGPSAMTPNLPSKVRYLGAFLYQGCLLLVKPKKGNSYEARHWLELASCEMAETTSDDPPLLNSFCLTKDDKNFYFAVSCPQEKAIWLPTIAQAIAQEHALGDGALPSVFRDPEDEDMTTPILMQPPALLPHSQSSSCSSSSATSPVSFAPMAGALTLRRPTQQQRQVVDRCLADVYSESCLAARAGAALFPDSGANAPTGFGRIMHRDSLLLSSGAASDRENSPAPTEKKRRRMSTRSFTGLSASETFTVEESALTSVPEDVQDEGTPTITHRRQRTYSYTMSSVRDALHVGRARPASVQNILHLQTTGLSEPEQPRSSSTSKANLTRSASIIAFLSARQRTKSAPVTLSVSSPPEPMPTSPLNNRPPPVDTTPVASSSDPSPNSDPASAIEFSATGRFRDRVESFPGSAEGGSQEGILSDMTDPSASEESAIAPPSPPEIAQRAEVRSPSNEPESLMLPAKMAPVDMTRLIPGYAKSTVPTPALTSAPSTLRRKNTGSFFMRFNPFASAT